MTNASALVAGLRPRIGAVLHNVTHLSNVNQLLVSSVLVPRHAFRNCKSKHHLIAVVAGILILAAVPRNVPSA